MKNPLYPEPPQLSVMVYADKAERSVFTSLCRVLIDLGANPSGHAQVVPGGSEFDMISDLAESIEEVHVEDGEWSRLLADDGLRVVRMGFHERKLGTMTVEYLPRTGGRRHPLSVTMSSAELGFPSELWNSTQREKAHALASRSRDLLFSSSRVSEALYGGIGVEEYLPVPGELYSGEPLPSEVFVSHRLLGAGSTDSSFRDIYRDGKAYGWEHGTFFSAWAPFSSGAGVTDSGTLRRAAAECLARVLRRIQ